MFLGKAARHVLGALTVAVTMFAPLASASDYWDLGGIPLSKKSVPGDPSSPVFKTPKWESTAPAIQVIPSFSRISRLGGVHQDHVAKPTAGTKVKSIKPEYNPKMPDGERTIITVNGKAVKPPKLMDWQLKSIVGFVDDAKNPHGLVTLTGDVEKGERPRGALVLNAHPTFEDNLTGFLLALFDYSLAHVDLAGKLPTKEGKPLVDKSHGLPGIDNKRSNDAAKKLREIIENGDFISYLIYDREPFEFSVADGTLKFQGKLYVFFWYPEPTEAFLDLEPDEQLRVTRMLQDPGKQKEVDKYIRVVEDSKVGKPFNAAIDLWRDLNPPVFDNALTVFNYVSFFRYVKAKDPAAWRKFADDVSKIKVERVETPVAFYTPEGWFNLQLDAVTKSIDDSVAELPERQQEALEEELEKVADQIEEKLLDRPRAGELAAAAKVLKEGRAALEKLKGAARAEAGVGLMKKALAAMK